MVFAGWDFGNCATTSADVSTCTSWVSSDCIFISDGVTELNPKSRTNKEWLDFRINEIRSCWKN